MSVYDKEICVLQKKFTKNDFPLGSIVAYTLNGSYIKIGIVVKHTPKNITIISGYREWTGDYPTTKLMKKFDSISRDTRECVHISQKEIHNLNSLKELLDTWNKEKKNDIELNFY